VRILRSIVQTLVLPVFNAWDQRFFSRPIASQFVGDNDSGGKTRQFQQFAEEFLRRSLVAMRLHEDIEDLTVCIHGPPQVILLTFNRDHDLVQMPLVGRLGTTTTNLMGVGLSKFLHRLRMDSYVTSMPR